MATNTVPMGRPVRPVRRPMARPPQHHAPTKAHDKPSTASMVIQGGLIGLGLVIVLGVIYVFGSAGISTVALAPRGTAPGAPPAPTEAAGPAPTTVYRDTHDGRVMVLEIDGNGTRVVGTMSKEDLPMAGNMYREPLARGFDSSMRLNAFSKTFK